jgi:hypothetical protein
MLNDCFYASVRHRLGNTLRDSTTGRLVEGYLGMSTNEFREHI